MTQLGFERLVERMYRRFEKFERKVEYRDDNSHEIIKGKDEESAYLAARLEVEKHAGAFPHIKVYYPF